MRSLFLCFILVMLVFLHGCMFSSPSVEDPAPITPTKPSDPSATPFPTFIPTPSISPIQTETSILTASPEVAEVAKKPGLTQTTIFDEARIAGVSWLDSGHLLISIATSGPITGPLYGLFGDWVFKCRISENQDTRYICVGGTAVTPQTGYFQLINKTSGRIAFQEQIVIPPFYTSTKPVKEDKTPTPIPHPPTATEESG